MAVYNCTETRLIRLTLRLLLVLAALKPCTCRSGVNFRFVFQHILTLFNLPLCLPELTNQVSHHHILVNRLVYTCFSSFSSRITSAISSFECSSFFDHLATISDGIVRCLTWSSPAARLIAALRTLRSASPTRVIDLHLDISNRVFANTRFKRTFPSSPHVPSALLDADTVQVEMAYRS